MNVIVYIYLYCAVDRLFYEIGGDLEHNGWKNIKLELGLFYESQTSLTVELKNHHAFATLLYFNTNLCIL